MLRIMALIIGLLASTSAFAQTCPSLEIRGLETKAGQPRAWTAVFDLDADEYSASLGAAKRTADIDANCTGSDIKIVQTNSSDGDDCTYALRSSGSPRVGANVSGTVSCSGSGPAELRSAKFYARSGPVTMNDARIITIVQTADTQAMRFGAIVVGLATKEEVRNFAQTMQDDHKDLNTQIEQLVQGAGLKPRTSPTSAVLEKIGQQKRTDMVRVIGPRLDRSYVESEISFHQRMLATFDQVLIPKAKSDEVKQFLQSAREVFAGHEHHARETAPILGIPASYGAGKIYYFCQPGSRDPC